MNQFKIPKYDNEYCNYIDSQDAILQYYKNQKAYAIENYIIEMERWLYEPRKSIEENTPLVIEAEPGIGKKTLLIKWMQYHEEHSKKKSKDIVLFNFGGGNNNNYFYSIYEILIKLRDQLDIDQKVELLEENLRKYFSYWLDVCDRKINDQIVNDQDIILIFNGIDRFKEHETNKQANVAFWLPKFFPLRVRVVCTCDYDSEVVYYFQKLGCQVLSITNENFDGSFLMEYYEKKKSFLDQDLKMKLL